MCRIRIFLISAMMSCPLLFASCDKNEAAAIDTTPPEVEIVDPVRDKIFKPGDTVFIAAAFFDEGVIRNGTVHVHDLFLPAGQDTVFSFSFRPATTHYSVDTFFIVNDPQDKNYTIYFDVIDKAENLTEKLRYFRQLN